MTDQGRSEAVSHSDGNIGCTDDRQAANARRQANRGGARSALLSEALLLGLLRRNIRQGALVVVTPDGRSHCIGTGGSPVQIHPAEEATVRRIARHPDLAIGEAYTDGTLRVEAGTIYDFLDLCLSNMGWSKGHWLLRMHTLGRRLRRRWAQHNPATRARANVAHHYDLSAALYEQFLDPDRQYSCAYFQMPDDTLESAQERKKRHIAAKLLLRPGQRVLDIGSGWGGLALNLAQTAGVDVTLSTEQQIYADRRVRLAGYANRVRFRLKDCRNVHGCFDRIVSVGMFEHVGIGHYATYFGKIRALLADDGIALIHTIGSADGPGAAHPWIEKYISRAVTRPRCPRSFRRSSVPVCISPVSKSCVCTMLKRSDTGVCASSETGRASHRSTTIIFAECGGSIWPAVRPPFAIRACSFFKFSSASGSTRFRGRATTSSIGNVNPR